MTWFGRALARLTRAAPAAEGSSRGPAPAVSQSAWARKGEHFSIAFGDGYQRNLRFLHPELTARTLPAAYACVMAFARAIAQCYPAHLYVDPTTKKTTRIDNSPFAYLLRDPNDYETFEQFIFNVVASLNFDGESIVLILRDARGVPAALHRIPKGRYMPYVEPDSGAIFYSIGADPIRTIYETVMAPARDVIHFRQYTPRHPLIGESAVAAAMLAMGVNVALSETQAAFFQNMARPSGILSTEQTLTKDQMNKLREAFKEQSAGWSRGELPILSNGLKFDQLAVNSVDAQLIDSQKMSIADIARVFGVPLPLIGELDKATFNNVEQLINLWLSVSLGSQLETLERSFDKAFNFTAADYVEFDTQALKRTDMLARLEALSKGVLGGVYTPNEARELEGLNPATAGDEPLLQVQMTPLSMLKPIAERTAAPPPPAPKPTDTPPPAPAKDYDPETVRALVAQRLAARMAAHV